ncbi:cryptochrome/photolyase family protein [Flavobacterium algicola]|uniref:cryptochrome/photolyase family protein n=1 Tax=Flavobacterium algicola TaxID=556529 RepID=UPI001EFC433F|nr:cryptochrome/photolyase family protein [Flavobacterium algicola]MCG9794123.1 cryptochrome/photolyase family protein [Flavobacterium algicola]
MKTLRLILGDQLNSNHSWFDNAESNVYYIMMEVATETSYATHHIQKVVGFFASMRNFSADLKKKGFNFEYIKLTDKTNLHSFEANISRILERDKFESFEYQLPDEYRLDQLLINFCLTLKIPSKAVDSEHFFSHRNELGDFFDGKKTFLMESFYHYMRKKHRVLMVGDAPVNGKWNFDKSNRKKLPKSTKPAPPLEFENDTTSILKEIQDADCKTIGTIDAKRFLWPVNRRQSLELLNHFVDEFLPHFGDFQDAMTPNDWSLYHSRVSFSLNTKMLSPLEVINAAIAKWEGDKNSISYNQVEGFVRQIIGWREYMRGIYWLKMPDYSKLNYFENTNKLPDWFWTGKTKMNCLKFSINQSLDFAYAHHIQRLMVTGNFALLAGIDPDEVDAWYLGIYIDAIEWVEITNTRGMSQFADGGIVGTKPYVSSASYIDKMSHYCGSCYYDKSKKTGPKACPFNSLYWNFYDKHEDKLGKNPRIGMMYNLWRKMKPDHKAELLEQAQYYLEHLNDL